MAGSGRYPRRRGRSLDRRTRGFGRNPEERARSGRRRRASASLAGRSPRGSGPRARADRGDLQASGRGTGCSRRRALGLGRAWGRYDRGSSNAARSRGGRPRPRGPGGRPRLDSIDLLLTRRRRVVGSRSDGSDRRGRRGGRRRRRRPPARRQERQRVDVALRVVGGSYPEMDIRHLHLRLAGRPDGADGLALGDPVAGRDQDLAEMEQCDRVAVRRPDRDRAAVDGQPAGERHAPFRHGADGSAGVGADVDSRVSVLAVFGPAELEPTQNRPVDGPRPGARSPCSRQRQCRQARDRRCHFRQHRSAAKPSKRVGCCQNRLQRPAVEPVSGHAGQP